MACLHTTRCACPSVPPAASHGNTLPCGLHSLFRARLDSLHRPITVRSYLGETCWDNSRCQQGDAEPYDAHRVSCARVEGASTARCVPTLLTNRVPRQPCACNRGTQSVYNLLSYFSCQSSDCNGHQCVLTTEDMNMYCDWNTEHSQSLLPLLLRQMAYSAYNSALSTALREALFGVVNTVTGYFSA
jgi:hypothetical protein